MTLRNAGGMQVKTVETKAVAQKWSTNVHTLSNDVKNQTSMLAGINSQKDDGTGGQGEGSIPIDYFDLLYERLLKEIELMM
jgi:hypothetical protein